MAEERCPPGRFDPGCALLPMRLPLRIDEHCMSRMKAPLEGLSTSRESAGRDEDRRRVVLYVGGFGLPDRTASAQRCLGNAKLLRSIGFEVVIMGKLEDPSATEGDRSSGHIDGFRCIDIREPIPGRKFPTYVYSAASVMAVLDQIGPQRVHSLIAYNYPATALAQLIGICRKHRIRPVVECADWYAWEGRAIVSNVQRVLGAFVRTRVLAPAAGNIILVSRYLLKYYGGHNVLVLPFVVDPSDAKWSAKPELRARDGIRRLVYAGSPGMGLRKDKINYLVASLASLRREGHFFHVDVVGLSKAQYLDAVPAHEALLGELGNAVVFHGWVPHRAAIALQRAADFSVFFRDPDRMTSVGFPTKFVEATSCGTPTITNPTSDISDFLVDGVTGVLARSHAQADIEDALRRALRLPDAEVAAMKERLAENPFHYGRWQDAARAFMEGTSEQ